MALLKFHKDANEAEFNFPLRNIRTFKKAREEVAGKICFQFNTFLRKQKIMAGFALSHNKTIFPIADL